MDVRTYVHAQTFIFLLPQLREHMYIVYITSICLAADQSSVLKFSPIYPHLMTIWKSRYSWAEKKDFFYFSFALL